MSATKSSFVQWLTRYGAVSLGIAVLATGVLVLLHVDEPMRGSVSMDNSPYSISARRHSAIGYPVAIDMPTARIHLSIVDGNYDEKHREWNVRAGAANYATATYLPNPEKGSTVIYGHDTSDVFRNVRMLSGGDIVTVRTDKDTVLSYAYDPMNVQKVLPQDTKIFDNLNTDQPQLVLITCDGLWSERRLIINLHLVGIKYA